MPLFALLTACGGEDASILVRVEFVDLQIPEQADSLCLGLWDVDSFGGSFGQRYALRDDLVASLAVDPGKALEASMMARVSRQGIEVNASFAAVDFSADAIVDVERCPKGRSAAATERGTEVLALGSSIAVSQGGGGAWIVAVASGSGQVFVAGAAGLSTLDVSSPIGEGNVLSALAVDSDNDCDDDILVLEQAGPSLWRRELDGFVVANQDLPAGAAQAVAALSFDVDGDLINDVALVGPAGLEIWRGGAEGFALVADPASGADLSDASGIASADLDGDGHLDLVVARSGATGQIDRVLYGDGTGSFALQAAAMPEAITKSLVVGIADIDGDGVAEIIVAGIGEPVRAYALDGPRSYVDRSFLLLPSAESLNALSLSVADWNGDCKADLLIAANQTENWTSATAMLAEETALPGALQLVVADLLGSGERDLLLADPTSLRWWKR